MLALLLGPILGFVTSFAPAILNWLNKKSDQAHELSMLEMQMKYADQIAKAHMAEIEATADIQEVTAVHKPDVSYGVQILDKMHDSGMSQWFMAPLLYLYSFLDALNGTVRPLVTYAIVAFYMVTKYARYETLVAVTSNDTQWYSNASALWSTDDYAILLTVVAYFFGGRTVKWTLDRKAGR